MVGGQHLHAGDVDARRAAGDLGEVVGGDEAIAVAHEGRDALFATGHVFGIGAAPGGQGVAHLHTAGQAGAAADGACGHVAGAAIADVVLRHDARALRRAASAQAIAEAHGAGFGVDQVSVHRARVGDAAAQACLAACHPHLGAGGEQVVHRRPGGRAGRVDDLDHGRCGHHAAARQREELVGLAIACAQQLVAHGHALVDQGGVHAGPTHARTGRARWRHAHPGDDAPGHGRILQRGGEVAHAGFQRVEVVPGGDVGGAGGQGQFDDAGAVEHIGRARRLQGAVLGRGRAAIGRGEDLRQGVAHQGLGLALHQALADRAQGARLAIDIGHQAQAERLAGQGLRGLGRGGAGRGQQRDPQGAVHRVATERDAAAAIELARFVAVEQGRVRARVHRLVEQLVIGLVGGTELHPLLDEGAAFQRQHVDGARRAEGDGTGAHFGGLGQGGHHAIDPVAAEHAQALGRGDGGQGHAQQAQELGAADLGHAVGAVEQALRQEGEELDQGDAGVALGKLRPLGRVHGHARQGVAHEVGVAAVVDAGDLERHGDVSGSVQGRCVGQRTRQVARHADTPTCSDTRSCTCVATRR